MLFILEMKSKSFHLLKRDGITPFVLFLPVHTRIGALKIVLFLLISKVVWSLFLCLILTNGGWIIYLKIKSVRELKCLKLRDFFI